MSRPTRPNFIERNASRLLGKPPSVRTAANVIVTTTAAVVVLGGVLMRVLDHHEYANIWVDMWWALQTVTTVGYGDVTPERTSGRIIGAFVMLEGIAFVTIAVAAITSIFVSRAARERGVAEDQAEERIEAKVDLIEQRLARLEQLLRR
jgi:voltage-gated potassium channel